MGPAEVSLVELGEWETRIVPGTFNALDRDLALALGAGDARLECDELREGIRLHARSWIGEVRFSNLTVRIVPKVVGGNLGVIRMLDYASGIRALARFAGVRDLAVDRHGSLVDLIGLLLADASSRLIRDGLLADYVTHETDLPAVRGRLLGDRQVRRRYGLLDRLECRYDDFETDIPENRLLAKALGIARRVCRDEEVRSKVARAHGVFDAACDASLFDLGSPDSDFEYQRRNEHYRLAHTFGRLFLRRLAVHDLATHGTVRSFAFLIDMNDLFEDFVARLLIDGFAGSEVRVRPQARDRSLLRDELTNRPYQAVIPDVLLEWREAPGHRGLRRVPVDAKYKLYDEHKLEPSDVYQTFFYGYAYGDRDSADPARTRAFIVYPSTGGGAGRRLRVQDAMGAAVASLHAIPLDIPNILAAIEQHNPRATMELASRFRSA